MTGTCLTLEFLEIDNLLLSFQIPLKTKNQACISRCLHQTYMTTCALANTSEVPSNSSRVLLEQPN